MHRILVSAVFVLLVAASVSAQETVKCESSDGKYRECLVSSFGRVVMTRQTSDTNCVEGKNWGYRDGVVWVDAGCRGEFAVPARGQLVASKVVVCESDNNTRSVCRTDTGGGVAVLRQLSRNACVRGRSWGFDGNEIWVDDGCRAEFVIGMGLNDRQFERLDQLVLCESLDGKPARCLADTSAGVHVVRTISDSNCRYGMQWGYDVNGIWVREGCRAEFAVRGPTQARALIQVATPVPVPVAVTRTPGTLLCESDNNGRKHCRVDTRYGVALTRQFSDNPCTRDRSWGVDENGVWVNDGCRAEFMIGSLDTPIAMTSSASSVVVCESNDGKRRHCPADTSMGVRLIQQMSDADCLLNNTWGVDPKGVWVNGGCRAQFALGGDRLAPPPRAPAGKNVFCESIDGKRALCAADTSMGVAVVRQVSDAPCILNSTWGYDTNGIWVTAGCRAEFVLKR